MKSNILEDLLHQELQSIYSTEKQMFKALTKMERAACHPKLRAMFMSRLEESREQVKRLEHMARRLGKGLAGPKCLGMQQLIEEEARQCLLHAPARNETYDAGLISAACHFICFEIERYELASTFASRLGLDGVERLLRENLNDQKELAARLNKLAKSLMNRRREHATLPNRAAPTFQSTFTPPAASPGRGWIQLACGLAWGPHADGRAQTEEGVYDASQLTPGLSAHRLSAGGGNVLKLERKQGASICTLRENPIISLL